SRRIQDSRTGKFSIVFMFTSILGKARRARSKDRAGSRNGQAVVPRVDVDPVRWKIKFFCEIDSIR
ncbi:MAG TPA: hypothetical protein PK640_14895, partial [Verrucomicrobiota bacterium]|nr:hypothetical protein [Verrucomicrobiota bacterium]